MRQTLAIEPNRELRENEFVISTSAIQFNGMKNSMEISSLAWPGVLCLCGVAMTVTGLVFLIPKQPLRIPSAAYERLPELVDRVLHSRKPYASMVMSSSEGQYAVLLSKRNERVEISLSSNQSRAADLNAIRKYFGSLGLEPTEDYETREEKFDITTPHLAYDVTDSDVDPAKICEEIFRTIYSIPSDEPFQFDISD